MKKVVQLEEAAQMIVACIALYHSPFSFQWWLWLLLFLMPDFSMIGYLINSKTGAIAYNIFHHKGVALLVVIAGFAWGIEAIQLAGIILFAHSSFDRMLGYGLKYNHSFKHTHLGLIGNNRQ